MLPQQLSFRLAQQGAEGGIHIYQGPPVLACICRCTARDPCWHTYHRLHPVCCRLSLVRTNPEQATGCRPRLCCRGLHPLARHLPDMKTAALKCSNAPPVIVSMRTWFGSSPCSVPAGPKLEWTVVDYGVRQNGIKMLTAECVATTKRLDDKRRPKTLFGLLF